MKIIYSNNFDKNALESLGEKFSGSNGFCYNEKGEFCIVFGDKKDYWNLPGGGREGNETPLETFIREVREETQADAAQIEFFQIVDGNMFDENGVELAYEEKLKHVENEMSLLPGVRYVAKLINIEEFVSNKDGFEIEDRKFVSIEELPKYITWLETSENGREAYKVLKDYMKSKSF